MMGETGQVDMVETRLVLHWHYLKQGDGNLGFPL